MSDLICYDDHALSLADRLRRIFDEQPTLRLTPSQLQRLLGSAPQETASLLERLVTQRYLYRSNDGYLVKAATPRALPVRVRHQSPIRH